MVEMQPIRNRARLLAAIALTWHVVTIAAVSMVLSCDSNTASEHAGMENCPLHASAPPCALHGDKHGTHECDCPTIGCAQSDAEISALFGAIGILPSAADMPMPLDTGDASPRLVASADLFARLPLSPPPRA